MPKYKLEYEVPYLTKQLGNASRDATFHQEPNSYIVQPTEC